ncbi:uncharacterized protein EDB93DRAFT_1147313 [Suillus bovinus]|uniref:uncharacterized protein n=1 Tax=Suillus bovinus TaxID=48563 RepID=UPI001B870C80|nr:uncharacterized protein EDB93DRAFT_1147313 [Suillus bovinus]KAG2147443.1 hypothetical protein EDB93DRAFT_1147313 [Suillus bovinus]
MNPLIFTNAFASVHIGVKECFCGKPTIEDHDFYFCSPGCARADSLRALGGQGDCHYRNVMQRAHTGSAAPERGLSRHKSAHQLRSLSTSRHVSVSQHPLHHPKATKALPTIEEVTSTLLAQQGRHEGGDTSAHGPRRPFESRNESVDGQRSPLPQRTLKRSLPSEAGLNKNIRNSIVALFRNNQTSQPDAKIRRESSITGAILQEMEEEDEEEAAWQRLLNRTEDRSRPPTLVHHQVRQTTAARQSRIIRRSASFAGSRSQIDDKRGTVMEVVFQLRQAWNEAGDFMPDFDERSDDEDC